MELIFCIQPYIYAFGRTSTFNNSTNLVTKALGVLTKDLAVVFHTTLHQPSYLIVHAIQVSKETLVIPPSSVRNLSTDVARVRGAETLFVMVPAE